MYKVELDKFSSISNVIIISSIYVSTFKQMY